MADASESPGNDFTKHISSRPVDLPPAVTTVAFDPVIPLLRVPIPAGKEDDPSKGPFVLAFKDEEAWRRAWHNCETKIAEQCEAGARMGCSINATKKCKPPWWQGLLPFLTKSKGETENMEACEAREMLTCVADAKDKCTDYAKDICKTAFSEARIADPKLNKYARKDALRWFKPVTQKQLESEFAYLDTEIETNFQGKILLGHEHCQNTWAGPVWVDGIAHGEVPETEEFEGWEGGLVRPKKFTRNLGLAESDELKSAVACSQPFWKQCEKFLSS